MVEKLSQVMEQKSEKLKANLNCHGLIQGWKDQDFLYTE